MLNLVFLNHLNQVIDQKFKHRLQLEDSKCQTLNFLKEKYYEVEFEKDLQKETFSTMNREKILEFTEDLKKKGIIKPEIIFSSKK